MKEYYSVDKKAIAKTTVKKSVFIAAVMPIEDVADAEYSIDCIKREYYDATHNCYAYIAGENEFRCGDDGEPQGTAGLPMLSVLKKRKLNKILSVVTRYFGGVKLGAAGLVAAYTKALLDCLDAAEIKKYVFCTVFRLKIDYSYIKAVDAVLKKFNSRIVETIYTENVIYTVYAEEGLRGIIENAIIENTNGNAEICYIDTKYCPYETLNEIC
ncbi:MAG: YigZ family protein [Clostridiales bacterium]|jgi:uncharacterized YigZ family protein|nr:YigZ family protein [Clostridiales bacterium]